mmetsp:Transcript_136563/g.436897  ORF Transcript_136563/g.436897 Transcript_136563/m.436897 type:complete len:230 (+) Transcript_136563:34-723(+)
MGQHRFRHMHVTISSPTLPLHRLQVLQVLVRAHGPSRHLALFRHRAAGPDPELRGLRGLGGRQRLYHRSNGGARDHVAAVGGAVFAHRAVVRAWGLDQRSGLDTLEADIGELVRCGGVCGEASHGRTLVQLRRAFCCWPAEADLVREPLVGRSCSRFHPLRAPARDRSLPALGGSLLGLRLREQPVEGRRGNGRQPGGHLFPQGHGLVRRHRVRIGHSAEMLHSGMVCV